METKINLDRELSLVTHLKIDFKVIPLEDFLGRIWLLWKDSLDFHLNIVSTDSKFIHCHFKNIKRVSWLETFIYSVC